MATRKIRLTLSGTQLDDQGPIIDVDFNGVNQDVDLEITAIKGSSTMVKEYEVDLAAGTYILSIDYKNDIADRDLIIEKIEYANDGTNYEYFYVTPDNSNLEQNRNYLLSGWIIEMDESKNNIINPSFDSGQPRTDDEDNGYESRTNPGSNPKYSYQYQENPITIYTNNTATFSITFS